MLFSGLASGFPQVHRPRPRFFTGFGLLYAVLAVMSIAAGVVLGFTV
jgi:hypothetical protein